MGQCDPTPAAGILTVAGYRRTGGIGQALATTADRAYTQLGPTEQQIARQVLLRLVNVSDQGGSGDTRRRVPRAWLAGALPGSAEAVDTVLEVFSRARLLTLDTAGVEITHEALLRAWPRLRQWIDTDRAGNLIRQQLDEAAAGWDRDRRDTAGLYRGSRLEAARTWATSVAHDDDLSLSPTAAAFLAASTAQEHRAARLRRTVLVVLSALLVLALIAAGVAVWQQHQASAAQRLAIARAMVAQADRSASATPGVLFNSASPPASSTTARKPTRASSRPSPPLPTSGLSAATSARSSRWRSAPMGAPWPPPAATRASGCGIWVIGIGPARWASP